MPVSDHLTLAEAAELLGVHYMTAYRYVRTGRLPATKQGATWLVDRSDVDAFGHTPVTPARRRGGSREAIPLRLEDRLVAGDESGAWLVVEDALAGSMSPEKVYTDLLSPAMASIGERWARGELDIETEHQATTVVLRIVGRLGPRFVRPGRRRGTVVLGAPAGDDHGMPVLLAADLVRASGFDVVDLGANTPPGAFGRTVQRTDALVAVGVCATRGDNLDGVQDALSGIASAGEVPIVLGGGGVSESMVNTLADRLAPEVWARVHLSASAGDLVAAIDQAAQASASVRRVSRTAATAGRTDQRSHPVV
jgi:MerR family transcriptional regulator, light-induced transcriptional regulator